ncbi:MAG: flagellar hook basal-body protein [Planctomycetaceae bacterium]|nr:flagellar hook basal-body protein [Planctomycetaceae bacterium]
MVESMNKIATGLNALMREYETSSNNIANSNTAGYKRKITSFSTELHKTMRGEASPLAGTIRATDSVDFSQGQLVKTERPLDVGLEGTGFLTLQTPSGRLYTRNGALQINILGQLTDLNGNLVAGRSGPVNVPNSVSESDITIDGSGVIKAQGLELGQLQIAEFADAAGQLTPAGNGCFRAPADYRIQEAAATNVRQGYREESNVQVMEELTGLLSLSRAFEANMSILKRQRENNMATLDVAKTNG